MRSGDNGILSDETMTRAGRLIISLGMLAALGMAAAGCGRKTALDTPYQAAIDARKQAKEDKKPLPPEPQPPVKDRHFILDPLI